MDIITPISKQRQSYEEFSEKVEGKITIENKTTDEINEEYKIIIPNDPTTTQVKELLIELHNKYEQATMIHRQIMVKKITLKSVYNEKFAKTYNKIYQEKKNGGEKKPGKDTIERLVEEVLEEIQQPISRCELAEKIYKSIIDKLMNQRKLLEDINIALGIEAKASIGGLNG